MTRKTYATKRTATKPAAKEPSPASLSRLAGANTRTLRDWRTEAVARVRALIRQTDPGVREELKWRKPSNPGGVPVWSHDGIICTAEVYKAYVKVTFANGAVLEDPSGLFNSSLGGHARRAIDIREGDKISEDAFKTLVRAAVDLNVSRKS